MRRCAMRARTWAVAGLASTVLLAVLVSDGRAQGPAKPAAVVNGQPITLADVDAAVRGMNRQPAGQGPENRHRQMRVDALGMLIDNMLLQQFLRKNAAPADPKEILRHLAELETALKKDNKKLADYLAENGMTDAQLREQITNALQWRDYTKGRVSDADVQQYYKDNKDFFDGAQVRASHVLVRVPLTGSEADVQATKAKLQEIRQEIESGRITFPDAAKKYSQC